MDGTTMSIDRRKFGAKVFEAIGGASVLLSTGAAIAADESTPAADQAATAATSPRANRIAVSTYSFWRFRDDFKLSIDECIDEAARMGFDGVEILHMQMDNEDSGYLQRLKRHAFLNGLDLCGFST